MASQSIPQSWSRAPTQIRNQSLPFTTAPPTSSTATFGSSHNGTWVSNSGAGAGFTGSGAGFTGSGAGFTGSGAGFTGSGSGFAGSGSGFAGAGFAGAGFAGAKSNVVNSGASNGAWSTGSTWPATATTSMWQASTFNTSAIKNKPFSFSGSASQPKPGKMDWFDARSRQPPPPPPNSNFGRVVTSKSSSSAASSSGPPESGENPKKRSKKNPVQSENGNGKDPAISLLSLPADQAAQALRNPKAGKACKVLEPDVINIIKCLQEWTEVWTPLWEKCESVLFGDMQVNKYDLRLLFSRRMPARPAAKSITAVLQGILAHDSTSPQQQALLLDVRSFWTGIRFRPDCKEKIEDEIKLAKADEAEREKNGMPASNRRKGKRTSNGSGGDADDVSSPSSKLLWDISCIQNQYVVRVLCGQCDVRAILMDRKAIVAWERHCIQFTGTYIPVPTLPPSNVLRSMGIDPSTVDSKTMPPQFSPGPHQSVQLDFCIPLPKDAIVDPKTHTAVSIGDPDGHLYFIFHRAVPPPSTSASASSAYASQPLVATASLFAPFKMEPKPSSFIRSKPTRIRRPGCYNSSSRLPWRRKSGI